METNAARSIASTTAKALLETKAVHFNVSEPFFFTSGWASPVYIDCRKLISYPTLRETLCDYAVQMIRTDIGLDSIDSIAGGETAGIPYAAWIADRLSLPMQYVRKKPKGIGRNAQVEGALPRGTRAILVDDLNIDGRTKVNFCNALRDAGAIVEHIFVLFDFNLFKESRLLLKDMGVSLHSLTTWQDVIAVAKDIGYFPQDVLRVVESFLADPVAWSSSCGGVSAFPPTKKTK